MGGLSPEQIKALLAKPDKAPRKKKSSVDANVRTYQTWFKLSPRGFGDTMQERPECSNSNCLDTRPPIKTAMGEEVKIQFTIVLPDSGLRMCRRCFLAGYGLSDTAQLALNT